MMCMISKERIAFCARVERTQGEVFTASPIALQSLCKRVPNEPIPLCCRRWTWMPECSFKIGEQQSEKKCWNCNGRAICNAMRGIDAGRRVCRRRDVSDSSDWLRPLWCSHSAQTELFFADVVLTTREASYITVLGIVISVLPISSTVTGTRPDLLYTITHLFQFNSSPSTKLSMAAKRVLRSLQVTTDRNLYNRWND